MAVEWQEIFDGFKELEDRGCVHEAIVLCNGFIKEYPQYGIAFLREKALLEFRNGFDREALLDFVELYRNTGEEEYRAIIFEAYVEPNVDEFVGAYQSNCILLSDYSFFVGKCPEDIFTHIAWVDEDMVVYYNDRRQCFEVCDKKYMEVNDGKEAVFLFCNVIDQDMILNYRKPNDYTKRMDEQPFPVYLVYEEELLNVFLQIAQLEKFVLSNWVFFSGEQAFQQFISGDMVILPNHVVGSGALIKTCLRFISSHVEEVAYQCERYRQKIEEYYNLHGEVILKKIKNGVPRILFLVSRFTTVLRSHATAASRAAVGLGMESEVFCEKDEISEISVNDVVKKIYEYKPDILFLIDQFRFEFGSIFPENLVVMTWIQDPFENVMSLDNCKKLCKRDVLINHILSYSKLLKVYEGRKLIDAPIPADEKIYRPYMITNSEKDSYEADICMVCHASDAEFYINYLIETYGREVGRAELQRIFYEYFESVMEGGVLYSTEQFVVFLTEKFKKYQLLHTEKILYPLAEEMFKQLNQRIYRQVLADWLIEAGFENIKLWGYGWQSSTKYSRYAAGAAENGEVLSKICQSSKIVLGNNIATTAAARAWETMLSGGFYMSNYIPVEYDLCDIRHVLSADEFVMFYDKQDLINKVCFYLEHENERQIMIQKGRQAVLKKMTFNKMMDRVIHETSKVLEQQIGT